MADEYISRENGDRLGIVPNTTTQTLTNANTEYSVAITDHTKRLILKMRTLDNDFQYGWATGQLNMTVPAGFVRDISDIHLVGRTLFLKCADVAGKIIEIEYFT